MTLLTWSDNLSVGFAPMDTLHKQFVERLTAVENAPDSDLATHWAQLIECTHDLFDRENRWMERTHFGSSQNHTLQHRVVLNVMREGLAQAKHGQNQDVRRMASELASWFAKHIQSLDAALALHLKSCGMPDSVTLH